METCAQGFDLERFVIAHRRDFDTALSEIRAGQKRSHWMWYIFPQLAGLGFSSEAMYFAIPDLDAARAYLGHPYLRGNLIAISQALLDLGATHPGAVMGYPDNLKLQSSMTLFEAAAPEEPVFGAVLDQYYLGQRDERTLRMLNR